jgi:hypothetical protein
VGVYVYPKLDPSKPAAWENSGSQKIVTGLEIERPEWGTKEWVVEPLDLEDVLAVAETIDPDVTTAEVCAAWGVQQDLVDLPGGIDDLPSDIEYSSDGQHLNPFPEGTLLDWAHQDLPTFLDTDACATPAEEIDLPPAPATPVVPEATEVCGADVTDVVLPAESDEFRYTRVADGILAEPKDDATAFSTETGELGYLLAENGRSALFPLEVLVPADEECALVPGAIEAVCESDVPYLGYEVALPAGVDAEGDTPLTITFLHPRGGEDYVVTDQPLSGSILWPGASATEPKQWPGYVRNEDGSYTQTEGNFAWTREGVQVLFEVNPSYQTIVDYPPASSECANPPVAPVAAEDVTLVSSGDDDELASTGATVAGAATFAVLLVAGGALVFWLRRRVQA